MDNIISRAISRIRQPYYFMLCVLCLFISTMQAQFRPIVFEGFTPDWQLLHYDSTLKVGGNPEDGEMFFPEYIYGENLIVHGDTIYNLMACIVDKDSFFSYLDIYHAQTGALIDRKVYNRSHTERGFVPQSLYFDEDGDVNIIGYRDVYKYKWGIPMLHLGSIWHLVRLKYAQDTSYIYGPAEGDTNSYKIYWPFGFSNVRPLNDSTFVNFYMWPSYVIRGVKIFFDHVNLDGEIVYTSDTLNVLWDLPIGTLSHGEDLRKVPGLDDEVVLVIGAYNHDSNQSFYWVGRFDLQGHLLDSFRYDSLAEQERMNPDCKGPYFFPFNNDHYIMGFEYNTDTGDLQIMNSFDPEGQLIEQFTSRLKWSGQTQDYSLYPNGVFNKVIPNPDGLGMTVSSSIVDEQGYAQIFIDRSDGYGNRKDCLALINADGYPSLLLNDMRYLDDEHLLVTFHTRRWGPALLSISIPNSAFSAVADKESPVELSIQAYPNPTTDLLYIESDRQDIAGVMIYDATGRQVMQVSEDQWSTGVVSTRHLTPGLYYLSIQYRQGSILSKPFMRQ